MGKGSTKYLGQLESYSIGENKITKILCGLYIYICIYIYIYIYVCFINVCLHNKETTILHSIEFTYQHVYVIWYIWYDVTRNFDLFFVVSYKLLKIVELPLAWNTMTLMWGYCIAQLWRRLDLYYVGGYILATDVFSGA